MLRPAEARGRLAGAAQRHAGWLGPWVASRVAVAVLTVGSAWLLAGARYGSLPDPIARWQRWDAGLLRKVAQYGYAGYPDAYPDRGVEAFFPGFPLVLALVHRLVPDWTAAGLLVSLLAGGVACWALARLAELDGVPGGTAVLLLVLSPYAVFLTAGYSEALFLCLALPGWLCARRGQWTAAGLLVAGASSVRVTGLFLAAGLVVHYAVTVRRVRRDALALLAPPAVLVAYAAYLHALTGDWLRWLHAQRDGWGRSVTDPWDALRTTARAAVDPRQGAEYSWSFRAEIVAVLVGVLLVLVLVRLARWGEATYVGLQVAALATSSFYLSVARATLLWFPLWVLLAQAVTARPWLRAAYVSLCAPLMALGVLTFLSGRWMG